MNTLNEVKEWLRIDGGDDDNTLTSLLLASKAIITNATGVISTDIQDNAEVVELYKLIQKMIVADTYTNREGSKLSQLVISLCAQLEVYKLVGE
jgi:uncharacterized phage protein (predicted DNA packaging)